MFSLWPLWFILFFSLTGCEPRERPGGGTARGETLVAPRAYVETVPGSTVTFTMRPVRMALAPGGPSRVVWFAETETTWDAYDVFSLRLDENADNVAAAGAEGPDAVTRPTQPYAPADRGWGHGGYPVISVTHNAAAKYCEWLTRKTGRYYRLPTTDEFAHALWETCGHEGDPTLLEMAWISDNSGDTTQPVGTKRPNRKGLYDLLGNVAEWCADQSGKPVACGGSFREAFSDEVIERLYRTHVLPERQTSEWTLGDPSYPPSKWWLRNAPFVGFRVVCEEPPE